MNFVMDMKIFGEFVAFCEKCIVKEIEEERTRRAQGVNPTVLEWRAYDVDKHLINVMLIEKMTSF
jgi:hypothetical protein